MVWYISNPLLLLRINIFRYQAIFSFGNIDSVLDLMSFSVNLNFR